MSHEAFPTFRAIPSGFLKGARCLLRGWKKSWQYLLGLVIILVIAYTALDIYATAQLNHQLNLIRQKGEPLTMKEAAPPEVADTQNAAILYARAAKALKFDRKYVPAQLAPKEAAAFISKNAETLKLIREATTKSQYRPDRNWGNQLMTMFPEYAQMRNLARLLAMQARYEAEMGNTDAALQDVRRLFVMTRHVSTEPVLIGVLVARALDALANGTLAKVLLISSINIKQARDFEASLPQVDWNAALSRALLGERTFTIASFNYSPGLIDKNDGQNAYGEFPKILAWILQRVVAPLRKLDEAYSLRLWQDILANIKNAPMPIPLNYNQEINEKIRHAPWYARMAKITLPVFMNQGMLFNRIEVGRRQREIALALTVYHSKYHKYPATLKEAEAVWESTFPLDPYSNKPFRYKSDGKTFLLYSVNSDGKDNGGRWKQKNGSGSGLSFGFNVILPTDLVWGH
jgi:hypothetical protein